MQMEALAVVHKMFINGICVDTVTTTQPHKRAVSHLQPNVSPPRDSSASSSRPITRALAKPLFLLGLMDDVDDLLDYRRIRELCRNPLACVLNSRERVIYTTRVLEENISNARCKNAMENSGNEDQNSPL
jgi:hypothetical protein